MIAGLSFKNQPWPVLYGSLLDSTFTKIKSVALNQERTSNFFGIAFILSIAFTLIVAVVVMVYGKNESFQLINSHNAPLADFFFKYVTYGGDGWMWVAVFLFCIFLIVQFFLIVKIFFSRVKK